MFDAELEAEFTAGQGDALLADSAVGEKRSADTAGMPRLNQALIHKLEKELRHQDKRANSDTDRTGTVQA